MPSWAHTIAAMQFKPCSDCPFDNVCRLAATCGLSLPPTKESTMPKNLATIEQRYEACGFAYTVATRMMYAPKFTITRKVEDKLSTDIVLSAANNWPEPNEKDIEACKNALVAMFPNRNLFVDSEAGLVPIYQAPEL